MPRAAERTNQTGEGMPELARLDANRRTAAGSWPPERWQKVRNLSAALRGLLAPGYIFRSFSYLEIKVQRCALVRCSGTASREMRPILREP